MDHVRKMRDEWEKYERLALKGSCVGDYKSTLSSATPGLHTKPDLIYVPNICL